MSNLPSPPMTTPSSPQKRRRGAQPGNLNARKHGLTPRPKPLEYNTAKLQNVDLTIEIDILRRQLQRLDEAAQSASCLAETIEIARVMAQTASALSRLIRAQVIVFSADTDTSSSILDQWEADVNQAIAMVNAEFEAGIAQSSAQGSPPSATASSP